MGDELRNRVYGSLIVAGMGDALGAATESWTIDEIVNSYSGLVDEFRTPPHDTFAGSNDAKRGEVTDDASQMYYLARALVDKRGAFGNEDWVDCLLSWASTSPKAGFMGPSTRVMVEALRTGRDPAQVGLIGNSKRRLPNIGNTNGAAMRVAPAGLVHPGDLRSAVDLAILTCIPSHDTGVAVSSAAAIAAGVAAALAPGACADSVVKSCLVGAALGLEIADDRIRKFYGPSFSVRLERALAIASGSTDDLTFLRALDAEIGCSVLAAESVPSAIAIFAYCRGDPLRTISLSATAGNDTDSIATIAGSMAGALNGLSGIPATMLDTFLDANEATYDLAALATGLAERANAAKSVAG
jgi:ADP-ribosylglycohydrolase